MIAVEGLSKRFGRKEVLRDVTFQAGAGEAVGLVGPNGAGKTTLLRILAGLVFRDAGTVRVAGRDPARETVEVLKNMGYLPGETSLYPHMRGGEFLRFALARHRGTDQGLMKELLDLFRLPLGLAVRRYSAGMKQKLALVAALSPRVDLLVLDEPDRTLDATVRLELRAVLRGLRDRGRTVLLSSHHLPELTETASRLLFVLDGRILPAAAVERIQEELNRELRVRMPPGQGIPPGILGEGDRVLEAGGVLRIIPAGPREECAHRLLALRPQALSYGEPGLEEIYRRLYLEEPP